MYILNFLKDSILMKIITLSLFLIATECHPTRLGIGNNVIKESGSRTYVQALIKNLEIVIHASADSLYWLFEVSDYSFHYPHALHLLYACILLMTARLALIGPGSVQCQVSSRLPPSSQLIKTLSYSSAWYIFIYIYIYGLD